MTAPAYSTNAALTFAAHQTSCFTDPWNYRGHKFPTDAGESDRCFCGETTREGYARSNTRLWNNGVFRSAITRWVLEIAKVTFWTPGDQVDRNPVLRRVASDIDADAESVAWCATRERAAACKAGLVIAPWGCQDLAHTVIVPSHDPKALFAGLVHRFFPAPPAQWPGTDAIIGSRTPLAPGVVIGPDVILGNDVIIGPNSVLANCTIGHGSRIGANCTIGLEGFGFVKGPDGEWLRFPQRGRVVIGDQVEIGSNTCIDRGALSDTIIADGAKIDNLVHVAHNAHVGKRALIIANSTLCGGSIIEDDAQVAPNAVIREQRIVGQGAIVGLGAVVVKDVPPHLTVAGNPARDLHANKEP